METASTAARQRGPRTFRERLLDFAGEYEVLQSRFDALQQELRVKNELLGDKLGRLEEQGNTGEVALRALGKAAELQHEEALQQAEEKLQDERRSAEAINEERRQADHRRADMRAKELEAAKAVNAVPSGRRGRSSSRPAAPWMTPEGHMESMAMEVKFFAEEREEEESLEASKVVASKGPRAWKGARSRSPEEQRKEPKETTTDAAKRTGANMPTVRALEQHEWFGLYKHSPTAKARVFVLYSGWEASNLRSWQRATETQYPHFELVVMELPGHGKHNGVLISNVSEFEDLFTSEVLQHRDGFREYFNCPFAIVGLEHGARLGIAMMRLLSMFGVQTKKFYAVGKAPPVVQENISLPTDTDEFFEFVADKWLPSKADVFKSLMKKSSQSLRQTYEKTIRADIALNASPVRAMPRRWIVGRSGKLLKRRDLETSKAVCINRPPGTVCFVTGREERIGQERWLQIDITREKVKPGWWCVQGHAVGEQHDLLELPEDWDSDPVDDESIFDRANVPFQIHFSSGDDVAAADTMGEWGRLTTMEPELVEHDNLLHDELILHDDVFKCIMDDFSMICGL